MESHEQKAAVLWGMSLNTTHRSPAPGKTGASRPPGVQRSHLKNPAVQTILAMHECCGKPLKIKFPVTAGISCVSCCWLQLSHGRQVTSSAGLTVLSSKAGLGPCHCRGGTCHFLPEASAAQVHSCSSWVEFHCHYLDSHQERSRSFPKVQDNPI